jgi:hypothetical protein
MLKLLGGGCRCRCSVKEDERVGESESDST